MSNWSEACVAYGYGAYLMDISFQDHPVLLSPTKWLRGTMQPSTRSGYFTVINTAGRVVSMQPGGIIGDRDPGTDGPWEQCKRTGNVLLYSVNDEDHAVLMAER